MASEIDVSEILDSVKRLLSIYNTRIQEIGYDMAKYYINTMYRRIKAPLKVNYKVNYDKDDELIELAKSFGVDASTILFVRSQVYSLVLSYIQSYRRGRVR